MSTPEGKVKREVKKLFAICKQAGIPLDVMMPVQGGYGKPGLDFHCIVNGRALVVETKAPGEWLTPRQREQALKVVNANGAMFVVSDSDGLRALGWWILRTCPGTSVPLLLNPRR